jgi:hypothetical protein
MRKITIEVEDKTFERLKKIKRASGYVTWRRFLIGCVLQACAHDKRIKERRSASVAIDKMVMLGELGRGL